SRSACWAGIPRPVWLRHRGPRADFPTSGDRPGVKSGHIAFTDGNASDARGHLAEQTATRPSNVVTRPSPVVALPIDVAISFLAVGLPYELLLSPSSQSTAAANSRTFS